MRKPLWIRGKVLFILFPMCPAQCLAQSGMHEVCAGSRASVHLKQGIQEALPTPRSTERVTGSGVTIHTFIPHSKTGKLHITCYLGGSEAEGPPPGAEGAHTLL